MHADEYCEKNESERTVTTSKFEHLNPLVQAAYTRANRRNEVPQASLSETNLCPNGILFKFKALCQERQSPLPLLARPSCSRSCHTSLTLVLRERTSAPGPFQVLNFQTMYIMADCTAEKSQAGCDEKVLVQIRAHPDGSCDIRPGLHPEKKYRFEDGSGMFTPLSSKAVGIWSRNFFLIFQESCILALFSIPFAPLHLLPENKIPCS